MRFLNDPGDGITEPGIEEIFELLKKIVAGDGRFERAFCVRIACQFRVVRIRPIRDVSL